MGRKVVTEVVGLSVLAQQTAKYEELFFRLFL